MGRPHDCFVDTTGIFDAHCHSTTSDLGFSRHHHFALDGPRFDADPGQDGVIPLRTLCLEILEDLCPLMGQQGHAPSVGIVVPVGLQMLVQVSDAVGQDGGLHFGTTCILLVAKVSDDATDVFHLDALSASIAEIEDTCEAVFVGVFFGLDLGVFGFKGGNVGLIGGASNESPQIPRIEDSIFDHDLRKILEEQLTVASVETKVES